MPSDPAWLGADGAISVPLGGKERIWLFGDTWLRHEDGALKVVSNSFGLQKGDCSQPLELHWAEGPSAAFVAGGGRGWLWPAGGILLEEGLFLVLHHLERAGPGPWDFRVIGSELVRISNPRAPPGKWVTARMSFPWMGEEFLVASSPVLRPPHVLLFATRASEDARKLLLARIPTASFVELGIGEGWEFWTGAGLWTSDLHEATPLFEGVGTELSVAQAAEGQGWLCVYSPGGISSQMLLRRAPAPEGPWGPPELLYLCPEASSTELYCYGAKLHPECSAQGLWITYSVNAKDGRFPGEKLARPRWLLLSPP